MRLIPLNQTTCMGWAQFLPEEIFVDLIRGDRQVHAVGIEFMDEPAGAAGWEEQDNAWVLRNIYVLPGYRRLGLGRELLAHVVTRMREEDCERLSVSYEQEAWGEKAALTPFFVNCGFLMEQISLPLGVTRLDTAIAALQKMNAFKKKYRFRVLEELSTRERYLLNEWLLEKTGDRLSRYLATSSDGCIAMRDGEINGVLLWSRSDEAIRLDYCWVSREQKHLFLPLLAYVADLLRTECETSDPDIEMVLSTEQAMQVYTRLLGDTATIGSDTFCTGEYPVSEMPYIY